MTNVNVNVKELFAKNLRENRRKCGFSQEKLAEEANVSTHYVAMIEIARNFPKSEVIERLARALGIEIHVLFTGDNGQKADINTLHQSIIENIRETVAVSIDKAFEKAIAEKCKK
jgi:transcriptional regulator with XRE-family HTH domain